jgi:hypothetical protein
MKLTVVLIFVLVFSACGNDTPEDSVDALCRASCDHKAACGRLATNQTKDSCIAACKKDGDPMAAKFKPGFLANLAVCYPTLTCAESDDRCGNQAMVKINPNWTTDPELLACIEKASTCNDAGPGFSDDYCNGFIYFDTAPANSLRKCLNLACESVKACLLAI